ALAQISRITIGLTRGFMYAGTLRIVASLWKVDDWAPRELMKRFYQGMLKNGLPAGAALRLAQLELSGQKRCASPYFWAGFVLHGGWAGALGLATPAFRRSLHVAMSAPLKLMKIAPKFWIY